MNKILKYGGQTENGYAVFCTSYSWNEVFVFVSCLPFFSLLLVKHPSQNQLKMIREAAQNCMAILEVIIKWYWTNCDPLLNVIALGEVTNDPEDKGSRASKLDLWHKQRGNNKGIVFAKKKKHLKSLALIPCVPSNSLQQIANGGEIRPCIIY